MSEPLRLRALEAAISQLHVRELTGANDGAEVEVFTFGQHVPWCAFFVAWCFRTAGLPLPGNRWELGSCRYMRDQLFRANALWPPSISARPGDIIFFNSRGDSDAGQGWHVGIVERVTGDRIHTVEGNTSNRVARRSYLKGAPRIVGIGRPEAA